MRRTTLMIMAAGSAFALTAAGASGFSIMNKSGQGSVTLPSSGNVVFSSSLCADGYEVSYEVVTGQITAVGLDDINTTPTAGCKNAPFRVTIGSSVFSGTTGPNGDGVGNTGDPYTIVDGNVTVAVVIHPAV